MRRPRLLRELGIRHCVVERGNDHAGVWLVEEDLDGLAADWWEVGSAGEGTGDAVMVVLTG